MTEYDTQYGDIVFAPDELDENDPFEELPSSRKYPKTSDLILGYDLQVNVPVCLTGVVHSIKNWCLFRDHSAA